MENREHRPETRTIIRKHDKKTGNIGKILSKRDILSPVKRDLNRKREHRPEMRARAKRDIRGKINTFGIEKWDRYCLHHHAGTGNPWDRHRFSHATESRKQRLKAMFVAPGKIDRDETNV